MQPTRCVYRIEAPGEAAIPFPTLEDAMRSAPSHSESTIATSLEGVCLAEAQPTPMVDVPFRWRPTVAGSDVLRNGVRGMERAS